MGERNITVGSIHYKKSVCELHSAVVNSSTESLNKIVIGGKLWSSFYITMYPFHSSILFWHKSWVPARLFLFLKLKVMLEGERSKAVEMIEDSIKLFVVTDVAIISRVWMLLATYTYLDQK